MYIVTYQECPSFFFSKMQLFKVKFLEFINIRKDKIVSFLRCIMCLVKIQTSVYQIKTPLFYYNLFSHNFTKNVTLIK